MILDLVPESTASVQNINGKIQCLGADRRVLKELDPADMFVHFIQQTLQVREAVREQCLVVGPELTEPEADKQPPVPVDTGI